MSKIKPSDILYQCVCAIFVLFSGFLWIKYHDSYFVLNNMSVSVSWCQLRNHMCMHIWFKTKNILFHLWLNKSINVHFKNSPKIPFFWHFKNIQYKIKLVLQIWMNLDGQNLHQHMCPCCSKMHTHNYGKYCSQLTKWYFLQACISL